MTFSNFHEVSSWKCRHATKSWESGHRKRCVILIYNRFPLMHEFRGEDDILRLIHSSEIVHSVSRITPSQDVEPAIATWKDINPSAKAPIPCVN